MITQHGSWKSIEYAQHIDWVPESLKATGPSSIVIGRGSKQVEAGRMH